MRSLSRLLLYGSVSAAVAAGPASGDGPCSPGNLKGCGAVVHQTAQAFNGAIIVPGSAAVNRAVASSSGCEGCQWFLVMDCDANEIEVGTTVNCNAAACPDGTTYRVYLQRPTDANPGYLDDVCLTRTRRIVTVADLNADMERYLTALRPPAPTIAVQPEDRAVVRIPVYFVAGGPRTDETALDVVTAAGPATLLIEVAAAEYAWEFGDGAGCATTEPGAPYADGEPADECGERIAHAYGTAGARTVTLRATWRGTYSFDVGYGPVGPLPIPGDGVAGPPVTRAVDVRPARAQLVGG